MEQAITGTYHHDWDGNQDDSHQYNLYPARKLHHRREARHACTNIVLHLYCGATVSRVVMLRKTVIMIVRNQKYGHV